MKKRALIIGCRNYFGNVEDVLSAHKDVAEMSNKLSQLGFEIEIIKDTKLADLEKTISEFILSAHCDSLNLVYFSGHGFQYKGINYLAPSDFSVLIQSTNNIDLSAYSINNIIDCSANAHKLIMIFDACRSCIDDRFNENYCEAFSPKLNTFIAHATTFNYPAEYPTSGVSYFTEAICNNLLLPNITLSELFDNVRKEIYSKGITQLPQTISMMAEDIVLNIVHEVNATDRAIYEYLNKYSEEFCEKYGYVHGEDESTIDASQRFDKSLLDISYIYHKIDSLDFNMTVMNESEFKLITFLRFMDNAYYSMDKYHTWYYRGRKVRMGEIPILPYSMQNMLPEIGKEIYVKINTQVLDNNLIIYSNLPDGFLLQVRKDNGIGFFSCEVKNGQCMVSNFKEKNINIFSPVVNVMTNCKKEIIGESGRNLTGNYVEFHPIFGNCISYKE